MEHSGAGRSMVAERPPDAVRLQVDGREVASYVWRSELPASIAPRPFLHPVRTLGGCVVTEAPPALAHPPARHQHRRARHRGPQLLGRAHLRRRARPGLARRPRVPTAPALAAPHRIRTRAHPALGGPGRGRAAARAPRDRLRPFGGERLDARRADPPHQCHRPAAADPQPCGARARRRRLRRLLLARTGHDRSGDGAEPGRDRRSRRARHDRRVALGLRRGPAGSRVDDGVRSPPTRPRRRTAGSCAPATTSASGPHSPGTVHWCWSRATRSNGISSLSW